ncbi:MAG: hypothetical protein K2H22_08265, partial [Muribaculaceae bacterium]|nr:hypothetical protein [Muribaculaceae bacterium]
LDTDEDTFAPPVLAAKLAEGTIGGQPLVRETNVIFPGYDDVTLPPTPWYFTPMTVGIVILLLSIGTMFACILKGWICRWWIFLYFLTVGIAGCIVAFLVFCSEHEATSPNVLIFWLNPLQLVVAVGIWFRRCRIPLIVMAVYNGFMAMILAILWATPVIRQVANPAVWPMLISVIPLSASILISSKKTMQNAKRKTQNA